VVSFQHNKPALIIGALITGIILVVLVMALAFPKYYSSFISELPFVNLGGGAVEVLDHSDQLTIKPNPLFSTSTLNDLLYEYGGQAIDDSVTFVFVDAFDPTTYHFFNWVDDSGKAISYMAYSIEKDSQATVVYLYVDKQAVLQQNWTDRAISNELEFMVVRALLESNNSVSKNSLDKTSKELLLRLNERSVGNIFMVSDV
jgi:hypothetical protein